MGQNARLCDVVQGVQFTVVGGNESIRALILRDALEELFGAEEAPESWLRTYCQYQDIIDTAAAERHRQQVGGALTVLRADRPDDFRLVAKARS